MPEWAFSDPRMRAFDAFFPYKALPLWTERETLLLAGIRMGMGYVSGHGNRTVSDPVTRLTHFFFLFLVWGYVSCFIIARTLASHMGGTHALPGSWNPWESIVERINFSDQRFYWFLLRHCPLNYLAFSFVDNKEALDSFSFFQSF